MSLAIDQEFIEGIGPFLAAQGPVPQLKVHDVEGRRARFNAIRGPEPQVPESVAMEILTIPQANGPGLRVHHLRMKNHSEATAPTAALIHFHGGGLIAFTPDVATVRLAQYVLHTGVQVFSVDYRLAPENPYPAALDDGWSTLTWVRDNASRLGIDTARIAVMGESAGGGLAAALAIRARDASLSPPIARQILCSPMLDDRTVGDVPGDFSLWNSEDNQTGWTAYLGDRAGGENVPATAAAARVEDVAKLPSLYMDTSQLDIFAKENMDYARRFVEAGIEVELHLSPGLPHGFDGVMPTHQVSMQYEAYRTRVLKKL
ncbi:hypothetical protein NLU13_5738 [Sarocladium strictum]|uniref:Alpha/beta hydrolase fold-3 domain-containing protein n=1 Tax=Sarocladium strictum TaxID=5046 RepID=A0AA39GHU6_SARSR|nr:hypothetical protein NLU13_5738 [Sarocladium strictum]